MLTILSAILGFMGPFVPELIKLLRGKQDNAHELAMIAAQAEASKQDHVYKMEAMNVNADIAETVAIHAPQQSFGVQVLDAAKDWPKPLVVPVFYAFALLDLVSGLVRPAVTYAVVGFYLIYKYALFELAKSGGNLWTEAATMVWGENDLGILFLVLGFWFGSRTVKSAFGGSASTGRPGGG